MKNQMSRFLLASTFAFTLVMTGCGSQTSTPAPGQNAAPAAATTNNATAEKVLTIANGSDMLSFDIHDHSSASTEAIHVNIFNYLLKHDAEGKFVPDLAESWENVNPTTWRFKLRQGVKFQNGDPFTAADVKFTLERVAKDEKLSEHSNYDEIQEVKVVDDHTVDVITKNADPILLNRLSRSGSSMLPSKYIAEKGWEEFLKNPVGTGPYKFQEWKRDDRLVLVKNDGYFGDKPKWDKVIFRVIQEDSTRVAELMTGGIDVALNIPPSDEERIESNEGTSVITGPSQRVMTMEVRVTPGRVTADPRVREAIDLAIDEKAIIDNLYAGKGTPTQTRVTPGNFGAHIGLYNKYNYDPERAKQLLAEAGYANGVDVTFTAPSGRYLKDKETAELVTAMLTEVGFRVKLELMEWSAFNERLSARKMDELFMVAYGNSMFDAALALDRVTIARTKDRTDYTNPEVEALYKAASQNMNPTERLKQFEKIQEIVAKELPQIYLLQMDSTYGVNDRIAYKPRVDEMLYVDEITLK
ncbi:ABC transporter substrate-binding protein [Brevibacillus centrosporus]|uniref:ABC transporter substrate-binding protein n=1 Tax=Brevibacillus centrosporus TaxID=54910 RepID=UPI002E24055F|nr:ABC transporter substrate-binding protein [Brevibacillus centrosporus]